MDICQSCMVKDWDKKCKRHAETKSKQDVLKREDTKIDDFLEKLAIANEVNVHLQVCRYATPPNVVGVYFIDIMA